MMLISSFSQSLHAGLATWCGSEKKAHPHPNLSAPLTTGPATHMHTHSTALHLSLRMHTFSWFLICAWCLSLWNHEMMTLLSCWSEQLLALCGRSWAIWLQVCTHMHAHAYVRSLSCALCWSFTLLLLHPYMYEPSSALCLPPSRCKHFYRTKQLQFFSLRTIHLLIVNHVVILKDVILSRMWETKQFVLSSLCVCVSIPNWNCP